MTRPLIDKEFGLDDLLQDPLVALLLQSDGILPETLRRQMYTVRQRLWLRTQKQYA